MTIIQVLLHEKYMTKLQDKNYDIFTGYIKTVITLDYRLPLSPTSFYPMFLFFVDITA